MYEGATSPLIADKQLRKHRHVKSWWYVILAIFVVIFIGQVLREVTREHKAEPLEVTAILDEVRDEEHRVGEDVDKEQLNFIGEEPVGSTQNIASKETSVGKPPEQKAKFAFSKGGGVKYGYVPADGPIPTEAAEKKDVPGIKYFYVNDDSETQVQSKNEAEEPAASAGSDSASFQFFDAANSFDKQMDQQKPKSFKAALKEKADEDRKLDAQIRGNLQPVPEVQAGSNDDAVLKELFADVDKGHTKVDKATSMLSKSADKLTHKDFDLGKIMPSSLQAESIGLQQVKVPENLSAHTETGVQSTYSRGGSHVHKVPKVRLRKPSFAKHLSSSSRLAHATSGVQLRDLEKSDVAVGGSSYDWRQDLLSTDTDNINIR